jgi:mannosyl-glycoprotein endo-beta-N-acetylglucosaminidase
MDVEQVHVGMDVFGRNCEWYGGYALHCAFDALAETRLSAGIFAIGWLHECEPAKEYVRNMHRYTKHAQRW